MSRERSVSSGLAKSQYFRARKRIALGLGGVLAVIATAARKNQKVLIRYEKVTTGELVERLLEPYSIRYERSRLGGGSWKYLYAFHGRHKKIEKYLVANITAAKITKYPYTPRWTVEF